MRLQLYPRRDGDGGLVHRDKAPDDLSIPTDASSITSFPTSAGILVSKPTTTYEFTTTSDYSTPINQYTKTYLDALGRTILVGPSATAEGDPNNLWPTAYFPTPSSTSTPSTSATASSKVYDYKINISPIADTPEEKELWGKFSQGVKAAVIIAAIVGIVAIVIASIWFCCGKPRRRRLKAEEDMVRYRERIDAERAAGGAPGIQVPMQTLSRENVARERASIAPVAARGAVGRAAERLSRHVSLRSTGTAGGGHGMDVPPPQYEEHVPPAHQRLAGGMPRRGDQIQPMPEEEEGMGMVADGKTPLSEIPFEDVVLTPTNRSQASGSASSSGSSGGGRDFGERHAMDNGGGNTFGHTNA